MSANVIPAGLESDEDNYWDSATASEGNDHPVDDFESMDPLTTTNSKLICKSSAENRDENHNQEETVENCRSNYPRSFKSYQRSNNAHVIHIHAEELMKSGDLESVLESAGCSEYVHLFREHKVNLPVFLSMFDSDFEALGIKEVGVRKKLSQSIHEIHRRPWHDNGYSLPKGNVLSCVDATQIISNIHARVACMESSLLYLRRKFLNNANNIVENQMVDVDEENLKKFTDEINDASKCTEHFMNEMKLTVLHVKNMKIDPRHANVDKIPKPKSNKKRTIIKNCLVLFSVAVGVVAIYKIVYK